MLKRRLSGTIELYDRETRNLFYGIPIDNSLSGFGSIDGNIGKVKNRGIEIMLRGDVIKTKSFRWELSGNITHNQNRVSQILRDSTITGITILAKGKPLNSFYLVEYAGVDPANGNAKYVKRDKSTTLAFSANDKVIWGTSDAPWYGGISTLIEFMGFDLSAQVNFFLDRELYNNDRNNLTNPTYFFDNMHVEILKEWRNPGDITDVPRPSSGATALGPANAYQTQTTRFLEDASFWRLRNITLGYNLPASIIGKVKIRSARIFVQGQNWWTATKYKSFDPEATGTSLVGAQYPALVQTTVGLSIGF